MVGKCCNVTFLKKIKTWHHCSVIKKNPNLPIYRMINYSKLISE